MDALLKRLQEGVVPLGQGLIPTGLCPQRALRGQLLPALELF